jgi:S-formylglutathione hydrolase FrmB
MIIYKSQLLPSIDTTIVYLPSNYSKEKAFPLIFMLHGWSSNYNQWNEIIDLKELADNYNFILVCPDGLYDSWYSNSVVNKNLQFKDFFFNVLYEDIINKFSVDKNNVFITGLSMGGFGAISLFLAKNEMFKSAGSTSGILDIIPFYSKWGMEKVFGDYQTNTSYWEMNSPINKIGAIKGSLKKIIFDCGGDDFAFNVNKNFYEACRQNKIQATFISQPGNHSKEYWKKSIIQHLNFFKTQFE